MLTRKILFTTVFILASISLVSAFSGGSGTSSNPWLVSNIDDLQEIGTNVTTKSADYIVTNDINASETSAWNGGSGFLPIDSYFSGEFDGAGYNITGLYINRPSTDFVGLFSAISNTGYIHDINLINSTIIGYDGVGGIVGYGTQTFNIFNCSVVGGNITSTRSSNAETGGIIGDMEVTSASSNVSFCYSDTYIISSDASGGIVGRSYCIVTNSYSRSDIYSLSYSGGLVGRMLGGSVVNTYSTGYVNATSNSGGLVGQKVAGTVASSYYDINTSGQSDNTGKGSPKTTSEMQTQSTFTDWDFDYTWVMDGYPIFQADASPYIINPVIIYPENATEIDSEYPSLTDVVFEWTNNDGASSSSYQLARDSNYNTLVTSGTTTSFTKTLSLDADDYYFRVRYLYDTGVYSDWTETQFNINTSVTDYGQAIQGVVYKTSDGSLTALSGAKVTAYSDSGYNTRTYITGDNGFYLFDDIEVDGWTLVASKDGYESASADANVTSGNTTTVDIYLEEENAPNYIYPNYVQIYVTDWIHWYEGVTITVYVGDSATPFDTKVTGAGGFATFELDETTTYRVTAVNLSAGINIVDTIPGADDDKYYLTLPFSWLGSPQTDSYIEYSIEYDNINLTSGYVLFTYNDMSGTFTNSQINIYDEDLNLLNQYNSASNTYSLNVTIDTSNSPYIVELIIYNTGIDNGYVVYKKVVDFAYGIREDYDFGWDAQWKYQFIAGCFILAIGFAFSFVNGHIAALMMVLTDGVFIWMGWIPKETVVMLLVMLAALLTVMFLLRKQDTRRA